jgi:hypothetical protein
VNVLTQACSQYPALGNDGLMWAQVTTYDHAQIKAK